MGTIGWIASGLAVVSCRKCWGMPISHRRTSRSDYRRKFCSAWCVCVFPARHPPKSTGKMDIKVMLGLDALICCAIRTSSSFSSVHSCLRCPGVLLHLCQRLSDRSRHEKRTGWMTLGQFSEIFFMLALPFSLNALVSKRYCCLVWSPLRSLWLLYLR